MAMSPMNTSEIIQALTPLIEVFDRFSIAYYIGGSVASSVHGRRLSTKQVSKPLSRPMSSKRPINFLRKSFDRHKNHEQSGFDPWWCDSGICAFIK